jgi:hypothetical protein
MKPKTFLRWALIALALRLVAAFTRLRWNHPDEWYQTVEYGNYLVNGTMVYTGELALHMRNMLWPFFLALPLEIASIIDADSVLVRAASVQVFTAILSLGALWGWRQVVLELAHRELFPAHWVNFAMWLMVWPWFMSGDMVRPSQENLSGIAVWVALGLCVRGSFAMAGFVAIAAAAFKFPSGLFAAGLFAAFALRSARSRDWKPFARFVAGLAVGLAVLGLPDLLVYGRPWESLWMHFQYNVLTRMSAERFGEQSAWVYAHFLMSHWLGVLAPLGIALAAAFLPGAFRGLSRLEPWAFALAAYLAGHLLIAHKEERFMIPVEMLLALGGWLGLGLLFARWRWPGGAPWLMSKAGKLLIYLLLLPNLSLHARQLWGFTWTADGTYFEIGKHLREAPSTCAIVSVRKPLATTLPWHFPEKAPEPALAYFPMDKRASSHAQAGTKPAIWIERQPACGPQSIALLHLHKPDKAWETERGCTLLASGALSAAPSKFWPLLVERDLASGTWYRCPSAALAAFTRQETRVILARRVRKLEQLPPRDVSGAELEAMVERITPTLGDPGLREGSFSEY